MRRNKALPIGTLLKQYVRAMRIENKLKEVQLVREWENVVGRTIARSTRKIYVYKKVLYVQLNSSIIRNELFMIRSQLIKRLNEEVGEKVIDKLVLK